MPHDLINGAKLYYEEDGSGPPILFHHGYAGSHDSWERVIPRLRDRYRCIAMDCRGAGDSEHVDDGYTIPQFASDVLALADRIGLDRFVYVGLSMGGAIGMQLGLDAQDRLERLVLVAPAPADGIQNEALGELIELVDGGDLEKLAQAIGASFAREADADFLQRRARRFAGTARAHLTGASDALVKFRVGERLGSIETPTLMAAGAADGLLADNLLDFQRLGNATLHVFSRAGHQVPLDVPEALASAIDDFIRYGVVTAETLRA